MDSIGDDTGTVENQDTNDTDTTENTGASDTETDPGDDGAAEPNEPEAQGFTMTYPESMVANGFETLELDTVPERIACMVTAPVFTLLEHRCGQGRISEQERAFPTLQRQFCPTLISPRSARARRFRYLRNSTDLRKRSFCIFHEIML